MSDYSNDWSCAADFLDDIEVDAKGKCDWTAVANAQTHIRAALRNAQGQEIASLRAQLASAVKVIQGVVASYPVAAGTSKYGHEPEFDGYGSIRECRLFLEKTALTDEEGKS